MAASVFSFSWRIGVATRIGLGALAGAQAHASIVIFPSHQYFFIDVGNQPKAFQVLTPSKKT